jgi:hypothetical protein
MLPYDPKRNGLGLLGFLGEPSPGTSFLGLLAPQPQRSLPDLLYTPPVKRRAFFSFHFDDVMRVNVVRNAWKFSHPEAHSYTDSSLWESRQCEGKDAIKSLIRGGVEYTSAACVLIGSETYFRPWVRYEIARAVIDERGLLAVHLNSIRHHRTHATDTRGHNPLEWMAVGKVQANALQPPKYYLFEKVPVPNGIGGYTWTWFRYNEHTHAVKRPPWLRDSAAGFVTPLSEGAPVYDFISDNGHNYLGAWIDNAARRAGR